MFLGSIHPKMFFTNTIIKVQVYETTRSKPRNWIRITYMNYAKTQKNFSDT
jgi:hypothetical protein